MITFRFQIYNSKHNKHINCMLADACFVWNRCLALQRKYYAIYKSFIPVGRLKAHFAKRYTMNRLHSQTVQEIIERLDLAYKHFFKHIAKRPPKFKKIPDFTSFVFKQGGYKLEGNAFHINKIDKTFKFHKSRDIEGKVKQVKVKRIPSGRYVILVITDANAKPYGKTHDGASVGMDFGLKTYLTLSDGNRHTCPEYLKRSLRKLRQCSKKLSLSVKGSHNHERRRKDIARLYYHISNMRSDFQWKLSHTLCRRYNTICIEDLSMEGMQKIWGRKISDLSYGSFVEKLCYVAGKYGVTVVKVDRWFASSKTCFNCGYKHDALSLKDREWVCPKCGVIHDRDLNAARNIHRRGISDLGSGGKTGLALAGGSHAITQESHGL